MKKLHPLDRFLDKQWNRDSMSYENYRLVLRDVRRLVRELAEIGRDAAHTQDAQDFGAGESCTACNNVRAAILGPLAKRRKEKSDAR